MNRKTIEALERQFAALPITRATGVPTASEILAASAAIRCKFHEDYVAFLSRFGGAMVGSLPIYGLRPTEVTGEPWSVVDVTEKFRSQGWPHVDDWYIISDDGFGNPIGVAPDGRVVLTDHDRGFVVSVLAEDFEAFLLKHLSE